jgi:hypothetical protein
MTYEIDVNVMRDMWTGQTSRHTVVAKLTKSPKRRRNWRRHTRRREA